LLPEALVCFEKSFDKPASRQLKTAHLFTYLYVCYDVVKEAERLLEEKTSAAAAAAAATAVTSVVATPTVGHHEDDEDDDSGNFLCEF
jgi:hypothetical protein